MNWSVVIPSAWAGNLVGAVESVLEKHPGINPSRILVVDDGARREAEGRLPKGVIWVDGAKPFIFARNMNLGARICEPDDLILMGDDVRVTSERCFDRLAARAREHPDLAVVSPGVAGFIGCHRQKHTPSAGFQFEPEALAFVCVYIPRGHWNRIGELDDRFVGYGCEDSDYCRRVLANGLRLGIDHDAVVEHGSTPSTFRSKPDVEQLLSENRARLRKKWGEK